MKKQKPKTTTPRHRSSSRDTRAVRRPPPDRTPPDPLESADILKRTGADVAAKTKVKHILLNWKDNNGGGDNEKAKKRTRSS